MNGDFSRDSFDPGKHFSRVLMQQGRVQLDADWNEQVSIFWHLWRSFVSDLVGPHAGPGKNCGFHIAAMGDLRNLPKEFNIDDKEQRRLQAMLAKHGDFLIFPGHYYVDGILCINNDYLLHSRQEHFTDESLLRDSTYPYLVYLDVWERHISHFEDDSIREVALRSVDTCTRAKVVWQVRVFSLDFDTTVRPDELDCNWVKRNWERIVDYWQPAERGRLRARARDIQEPYTTTTISPQSQFRGPENQLYRIQIHDPGVTGESDNCGPTFKWSRDNGSNNYAIVSVEGAVITVADIGRDSNSGIATGNWVEIVDDLQVLQNTVLPLVQVDRVDRSSSKVILKKDPGYVADKHKHPVLVRWDQKAGDPKRGGTDLCNGAAMIKEEEGDRFWLNLEDGVQLQFERTNPPSRYRSGDYWLIPARTAIGDVIWPQKHGKPYAMPPHGTQHHYAPLAIINFEDNAHRNKGNCRLKFDLQITH